MAPISPRGSRLDPTFGSRGIPAHPMPVPDPAPVPHQGSGSAPSLFSPRLVFQRFARIPRFSLSTLPLPTSARPPIAEQASRRCLLDHAVTPLLATHPHRRSGWSERLSTPRSPFPGALDQFSRSGEMARTATWPIPGTRALIRVRPQDGSTDVISVLAAEEPHGHRGHPRLPAPIPLVEAAGPPSRAVYPPGGCARSQSLSCGLDRIEDLVN
jgi:hypothetical protein